MTSFSVHKGHFSCWKKREKAAARLCLAVLFLSCQGLRRVHSPPSTPHRHPSLSHLLATHPESIWLMPKGRNRPTPFWNTVPFFLVLLSFLFICLGNNEFYSFRWLLYWFKIPPDPVVMALGMDLDLSDLSGGSPCELQKVLAVLSCPPGAVNIVAGTQTVLPKCLLSEEVNGWFWWWSYFP